MNPHQTFQLLFGTNSISENKYHIRQLSEHQAKDMGITRGQLFHKMPLVKNLPKKLFKRKFSLISI